MVNFLQAIFSLFCGSKTQPQHSQEQVYDQQPQQGSHQQPQKHSVQHQGPPTYPPKKHQDLNQLNQSDEKYTTLRAQANEHGDQMAKCFQQSHEAYNRKDGALAKELSNKGKGHQRKMEELNKQASDWIFRKNNEDSEPDEIDLHGLYVKEAIARAEEAINNAKGDGKTQLKLIVGKGMHSQGGVTKIKPAIEDLMQKHHLQAELDPHNAGVLIVQIEAPSGQRGIGTDEIVHRLERDDEACVIM